MELEWACPHAGGRQGSCPTTARDKVLTWAARGTLPLLMMTTFVGRRAYSLVGRAGLAPRDDADAEEHVGSRRSRTLGTLQPRYGGQSRRSRGRDERRRRISHERRLRSRQDQKTWPGGTGPDVKIGRAACSRLGGPSSAASRPRSPSRRAEPGGCRLPSPVSTLRGPEPPIGWQAWVGGDFRGSKGGPPASPQTGGSTRMRPEMRLTRRRRG